MDDYLLVSNENNKKISLKLTKDEKKKWLVNRSINGHYEKNKIIIEEVLKKKSKEKASLKVSVPISIFDAVQSKNNSEVKTPTTNQINKMADRLSPTVKLTRVSAPFNPTGIRTFRHPVPTSKGRTNMKTYADKYDQIVKTPKPIPPKTTFQAAIVMPLMAGDLPPTTNEPTKDRKKNKTEDSIIAKKPSECDHSSVMTPADSCSTKTDIVESPLVVKHKLPFAVVPQKGSYSKPSKPVNKENSTQTVAEQNTQTEICFFVTEMEMSILKLVNNSGLTLEELQDCLENFKKEKEKKHDNEASAIDLLNKDDNHTSDIYAKIVKQSTSNKCVLNKIVKFLNQNQDLSDLPTTPPPETHSNHPSTSFSESQPPLTAAIATKDTSTSPLNPQYFALNDLQRGIAVSAMLVQLGLRIIRTEPQEQGTQTEDHSNNKKRRITSTTDVNLTATELLPPYDQNVQRQHVVAMRPQELPALVPQIQEIPVFQAPSAPIRTSQQHQQYAPENIERQTNLYPNMSSVPAIPHQRTQKASTRNNRVSTATVTAHHPFEPNVNQSNTTFSTQQAQVQMPPPAQPHLSNLRRQNLHQAPICGHPHLSRIVGTHEANMNSQTQQWWTYPQYYDRQGNIYSQRHQ